MPKYRRMMESNGASASASGQEPEYGAIFMSNSSTRKECLKRGLFGLPIALGGFVKQVKAGMLLFLFEFESRELHGVFQACSDGAINIEPNAFCSSGKQFPAQVQRLLKLFSSKKVERPRPRKTAVTKSTKNSESSLRNTAGDRGLRNRCPEETDKDAVREFPLRGTSARDRLGRRLTENYGLADEADIGVEIKENEYSGDASEVCRRLVDPKMHVSKDRVGYDLSMNNSSRTDALTYSDYILVNDPRVPKNLRHTASGWLGNEYHGKASITQASSWSNHEERLNIEADPVVPAQSSVPPESLYGTNTGCYDPCEPGIMGYATMESSRHDHGAPNVDSMGSASFIPKSNRVMREEITPVGGYVSDTLPSETFQPFPDEHNDTNMNKTSSLGLDYYIPMPIEHPEYQTNSGINGVACSESESRYGHLRHSQFPAFLTSAEATESMRNSERLSYSSRSIFPSFANPLSSGDLSPKYGVNNEISAYQHQEGFEGHASYSNDMVVHDSRIYPSFSYPSRSGDGVDLYPENRTQDIVIRKEELVNPAEFERKRTRKSVFSRLAMPSKENQKEDTSSDTESVDEVMAFLKDCHKHWMEQKRPKMSNHEVLRKPKKKNKKIHTPEVLDTDLILPFSETTPDDLLDCEESMEHSAQKRPFIDFRRRSKKSRENPTQGCKESPEHSAPQNKKRKLLRPKLIEDDSEKDRGNNGNPIENVLASQSAKEVPFHDLHGRSDQ
ncbi:hypothetical protein EUTSA_v10016310mg [Eutrema salsugineum]|uniref:DCD domain-containing protein n=1 Tax=Eutrema salsugineum TaxID=72664 RepID=V4M771_EUTSA|nr:hypothetical protein EUTSA_v10016310mg [Eutrema salsugineum]